MNQSGLEKLLYTDEEFHTLYNISGGFNDDVNKNHRVRGMDETFASFIDEGSTALINEHASLIEQLL